MRAHVLTFRYVGALLVVAGLLVAGQTVIHQLLVRQEGDARVINLAGRQRMLGQRLCTLALALSVDTGDAARATRDALARTADDWERNHGALRTGRSERGRRGENSAAVLALFAQIDPDHHAMLAAARAAAALPVGQADPGYARIVRDHEGAFIAGMDRIVAEYEREAKQRIVGLRRLELLLLALALLVLALDGLFVFRPAMSEIRTQLVDRDLVHHGLAAVEPTGGPAAAPGDAVARLEHRLIDISDRAQVRLAQDLHDGLGQQLIGVSYLLRPLRDELTGPAAARIGEVERMVADAIAQTRDLVRGLHSRTLEIAGLTAALDELAGQVARVFGVACRVRDRAGVEPALAVRGHLHRIAREAVVNAARHAAATAIEIELAREAGALRLVVRDDGVGIPEHPRDGMGLHLMAYRARMLGASLDIAAGWPRGTTVTCSLPLDAAAPEEPA
jgi:signal transduction histidine kinase